MEKKQEDDDGDGKKTRKAECFFLQLFSRHERARALRAAFSIESESVAKNAQHGRAAVCSDDV
jgi:hypothetical protein